MSTDDRKVNPADLKFARIQFVGILTVGVVGRVAGRREFCVDFAVSNFRSRRNFLSRNLDECDLLAAAERRVLDRQTELALPICRKQTDVERKVDRVSFRLLRGKAWRNTKK